MEICSEGHKEIVHDEHYTECPLCKAQEEIGELENRVEELEEEGRNDKSTIESLNDQIADLEKHMDG